MSEQVYYIEQWGSKNNPKDFKYEKYNKVEDLIDGMVYTNTKSTLQTHAYFRIKVKEKK